MQKFFILFAGLLVVAVSAAPSAANDYRKAHSSFDRDLKKYCPQKKLNLTNMDMDTWSQITESYLATLPKRDVKKIYDAAAPECKHVEMGLYCSNTSLLREVWRRYGTEKLARHACASGYECSGQYDCNFVDPKKKPQSTFILPLPKTNEGLLPLP